MEVCPCGGVDIWGPCLSFVMTYFLERLVSHELTAYLWFWPLFNSVKWPYKPDKFESLNSLKVANILGLCSDFVECESFLEWNPPDILVLCEANLVLRTILKRTALALHDFAGNLYLIWFVNCRTIKINLCKSGIFHNGWFEQ